MGGWQASLVIACDSPLSVLPAQRATSLLPVVITWLNGEGRSL